MSVVLRCPNCGTTRATPGTCEACHHAEVRYFCTNHKPGLWLDTPRCSACGASFGDPPRPVSASVIARPVRTRPVAAPLPRPASLPPPSPYVPPPSSYFPPEPPVHGLPPPVWLTLLRNLILARRGSASARPERGVRRGAGGCLLRAFFLAVVLVLALVATLLMFGWSMLQGF
jgi:hypothetical protein